MKVLSISPARKSLRRRLLATLFVLALLVPLTGSLAAPDAAGIAAPPAMVMATGDSAAAAVPAPLGFVRSLLGAISLAPFTGFSGAPLHAVFAAGLALANPAPPPPPPAPPFLPPGTKTAFDFDGDRRADHATWRPGDTVWRVFQSSTQSVVTQQWGASGDRIVPADYDNDGKTDYAVWTPANGVWNIRYRGSGLTFAQQWGAATDIPVPGDYDGDGKADLAVWRPSSGMWYVSKSSDGGMLAVQFGSESLGDYPTAGDYDGDGITDIAVRRGQSGVWYFRYSSSGIISELQWGIPTDVAAPADYDADGKTDFAVWRAASGGSPGNGTWYVYNSFDGAVTSAQLGATSPADVLVPADYDWDGKADWAAWRSSTAVWEVWRSSNSTLGYQTLGLAGDIPIPAAFIKQTIPPAGQPPTNPTGSNAAASPNPVTPGTTVTLSVQVTAGANPTSTGLYVNGNLTSIGGTSNQPFYHNGNNFYVLNFYVPPGTAAGGRSLQLTVGDGQGRNSLAFVYLTVNPPSTAPTGYGGAAPNQVVAGYQTRLTVTVTPGTNPASSGLFVSGNLSSIGGGSSQQFFDNGTNGDLTAGDNVFSLMVTVPPNSGAGGRSLQMTISDAQGRSTSNTFINFTVTAPTIQLSKEYIYSGSRMLAVEDANAP